MSDEFKKAVDESFKLLEELTTDGTASKATLHELLVIGRFIWGPRPVGQDSTANLPGILVRLMKTTGDLAAIARHFGSCHWEHIEGETPLRIEARNEIKKELGNIILSTIRWCDDLGLDVGECVARAITAQRKYAMSNPHR